MLPLSRWPFWRITLRVAAQLKPHVLVGRNILRLRLRAKLTQERLAEEIGIDLRSLQRIEAGSWNMTVDYLDRFRAVLHCSWGAFFRGMD